MGSIRYNLIMEPNKYKIDNELLKQFIEGESEAFDAIVHRHHTAVYRLAYKFTRNRSDAEDVAQDTFLRAYEFLKRNPKSLKLKPWLMTICVNLCRNLAKKKKSFNFSDLKRTDEDTDFLDRVEDKKAGPDKQAKVKQTQARVQRAMELLPPKYQIVLQLRFNEDMSYQEIADTLRIPMNTVKVHINRAKSKLKTELT